MYSRESGISTSSRNHRNAAAYTLNYTYFKTTCSENAQMAVVKATEVICRILYDHYLPTVILIIIGIPSPTHSFTLGLNPSFSANPPYRSLSFFFFRIHYMDFTDCLLLLLSISVFLLFSFFSVFTLF